MAPIVELNSARFNFHRTYTKVRDISNKVILDLPIIGPIKRNMPGRKESLLISTVIPLGVGLVEWGLYEGLRQTGIDPIALGLVTLGVLYVTKDIERKALVERDWCSNTWTLGFIDLFRLFEKWAKYDTLKNIYSEPLTAQMISKLIALVTYPVTLKAINDAIQSQNIAYLAYITFVQNLGDIIFAELNETELKHPGSVKRTYRPIIEDVKW